MTGHTGAGHLPRFLYSLGCRKVTVQNGQEFRCVLEIQDRKKNNLLMEGVFILADHSQHRFFLNIGRDFFVLDLPFIAGKSIIEHFINCFGNPSRDPVVKCGGGCSGDEERSGLVTTYLWELPGVSQDSIVRKLTGVLGLDEIEVA